MANQVPGESSNENLEREDNEQQRSDSGNTSKGVLLQYNLVPMDDAAAFSINKQSSKVTDFLRNLGTFQATNGVRIALANRFPEWKESLNTIYLEDGSGRGLNRPDITRFPLNGKKIRNNKIDMFNLAMKELIETVKSLTPVVTYESRNKANNGKITLN